MIRLLWLFAFAVSFGMVLGHLVSASGPNCPGMDPTWLGVCE